MGPRKLLAKSRIPAVVENTHGLWYQEVSQAKKCELLKKHTFGNIRHPVNAPISGRRFRLDLNH